MPIPITVAPMIWLRASFSFRMRPAVDGRGHPRDAHQPEVLVDADLGEVRAEGAGRRHARGDRLRGDFAVRGHLVQVAAGQEVGVGQPGRGVGDEVDAAVGHGDLVRAAAVQRRPAGG